MNGTVQQARVACRLQRGQFTGLAYRAAVEMGGAGSKKLPKEDMQFLMENTNFTKHQIKAWYKGFMVCMQYFSVVELKYDCCKKKSSRGVRIQNRIENKLK